MNDERFDIDVGYRDPDDLPRDDFSEDKPSEPENLWKQRQLPSAHVPRVSVVTRWLGTTFTSCPRVDGRALLVAGKRLVVTALGNAHELGSALRRFGRVDGGYAGGVGGRGGVGEPMTKLWQNFLEPFRVLGSYGPQFFGEERWWVKRLRRRCRDG